MPQDLAQLLQCISAVTLETADMVRAVQFYRSLGFPIRYGGDHSTFTSFWVGPNYLNLIRGAPKGERLGRVIFYVRDVDAMYRRALEAGCQPSSEPADAPWQERYFHLCDPDGHTLSFARPLSG